MRQRVLKTLKDDVCVASAIDDGWTASDPCRCLLQCARLTLCYNVLLKSYPSVLPDEPPPSVMRRLPGLVSPQLSFCILEFLPQGHV
jgi:hypothetical protein